MKKVWIWVGVFSVCVILISIFRSHQTLEEIKFITQGLKTVGMSLVSISPKTIVLIKGNGSYKLDNPLGTKKGVISWSQYGQDILIDKLLKEKRNGFFVEIGGFDGETFSNTLLLEKGRGWSGLLVEANPFTFEIMVKKDRKCYMANACISNTKANMTFIIGGFLTSAKEIITNKHQKRIDTDAILYAKEKTWQHSKENVVANCYSLLSIFKSIGQTHIDYFSLDVEGAEMFILESMDWKQLDIDIFTIETDQVEHRQQILPFMESRDYKWIEQVGGDDLFVKMK